MAARRKLSHCQSFDLSEASDIQLAFAFSDKSVIPQVIDKLCKTVVGLNLRREDDYIVSVPEKPLIYQIPNQLRDLQRAANYVGRRYPVNPAVRCGVIGHNDTKVVLNLTHAVGDGGYFKYITDHLFDPVPANLPLFPKTIVDLLPDEVARCPDTFYRPWEYDPDITRFTGRYPNLTPETVLGKYETMRFPAPSLQCFDRSTGKIKNLNDYLWLSLILSTAALDSGKLPTFAGASTCVDMRSRLRSDQIDYSVAMFFSQLTCMSKLRPDATLRSVGAGMRDDLVKRRERLDDFGRDKFIGKSFGNVTFPGTGIEITNMGVLNIKPPIKDAWASLVYDAPVLGYCLAGMAFSVVGSGKNDLVLRLRYTNKALGDDEVFEVAKAVDHFLRNISLDRTVQSAFDEIKAFMKN
jgi:hypothetical protein